MYDTEGWVIAPVQRLLCLHCKKKLANRPRRLCWGCYYTPGVKDRYPPTNRLYSRRGIGGGNPTPPLPDEPTDAPPGSLAKMRVMQKRLLSGRQPHHPLDNKTPVAALLNPFAGLPSFRQCDGPSGLE